MKTPIPGLHHVTAIAGEPAANLAFYRDLLGLRLVKKTVNFDDPGTYHLYYGDGDGSPGTILTFFPWPGARRGSRGAGQATTTAFAVPTGALDWWHRRFADQGVLTEEPRTLDQTRRLVFFDPDGLRLELVEVPGIESRSSWEGAQPPSEVAVRGFHGVTLSARDPEPTLRLLTEVLGYERVSAADGRWVLAAPGDALGNRVELVSDARHGHVAAGTVHHVAFRVASDESELAWREELLGRGFPVSPVMDRNYFHSIYFREPGGVLFELATDPPGFTIDERRETLGSELRLPPFLEEHRGRIEAALPALEPAASGVEA